MDGIVTIGVFDIEYYKPGSPIYIQGNPRFIEIEIPMYALIRSVEYDTLYITYISNHGMVYEGHIMVEEVIKGDVIIDKVVFEADCITGKPAEADEETKLDQEDLEEMHYLQEKSRGYKK